MKALLWMGLLLSLLVLAMGASWLSVSHWMTATIARAAPPPVIPPGRENVVMTFLGPVMKNGFSGLAISNISLSGSAIRLQLARRKDATAGGTTAPCTLPDWATAPGTLEILPHQAPEPQCIAGNAANCGITRKTDLVFAWAACTTEGEKEDLRAQDASEWINGLSNRNHEGIWEMPRDAVEKPQSLEAGLLTPIVLATGLEKVFVARMLLSIAIGLCCIAGVVLRWKMGSSVTITDQPTTAPRHSQNRQKGRGITLAVLLFVGIFLRMQAAATLPRDADEGFQGEYVEKILSDDHDSWVHPPLYRAIHKAYFDVTGFSSADATWKLRIPSIVFSILALCFLVASIVAMNLPYYAEFPFALAALSPIAVNESVLARPYGLAMFGATLCLIATSFRDLADDKRDAWFPWFIAMVAIGLTIWTDLVTAVLTGTFFLARWLHPRSFSANSNVSGRIVTAICVAIWAIPFALGLPGAVRASQTLGWPFHTETSSLSVFDRVSTIALDLIGLFGFVNRPGPFASFLVIITAVGFVFLAMKWARTSAGMGLGFMLVTLAIVSSYIGMRPRNIVFLPIAFSFVASLVVARIPAEVMQGAARFFARHTIRRK